MLWHIILANILLIVNVILKDGIRMFLNTLTKKNRSQLQNNIFFLWWNNKPLIRWFSIKYERTFCSLLVFPPPPLPPAGFGKIQRESQNIRTYYMLSNKVYVF